ncbi:signal peptidase [Paracoccus liaowanqingii]|uniref:Signal peptidase n=1 Tax=Paracoccus liaowanqingii TaxID=2560053 RepID=A0A4Z1CES2_9RHOB|nr:imelysin family protein [Paracoccus liaowanqingii]TGN53728.1 signal peptidase [Paracoccus liaowanqingii]
MILILGLATGVAQADVAAAVQDHILPRHANFAAATAGLAQATGDNCTPDRVGPAYQAAYDAWMGVQHIRLGPIEIDGRGLAIAFWPDPKASGLRAQQVLLGADPAILTPDIMAQQSVAARGLTGLERLLYPTEAWPVDTCPLIKATADDLARIAADLNSDWQTQFGPLILTAGQPGNTRFLSEVETRQALFTQIVTGLDFIRDQRLGRPLGSFDRPAPDRAEARASARSLRNIQLSLAAIRQMAAALVPEASRSLAALDRALGLARDLDDPLLAGVATSQGRLRVEILQQAVDAARTTVVEEMGPALGVTMGFNAMDGD